MTVIYIVRVKLLINYRYVCLVRYAYQSETSRGSCIIRANFLASSRRIAILIIRYCCMLNFHETLIIKAMGC